MAENANAEESESTNKPCCHKVNSFFKNNYVIISLLSAIVLGIVVGTIMKVYQPKYGKREVMYAGFLGNLLIRMLKCITIPLFTASVITALSRLNMKKSGIICIRTIIYFLCTSFISSALAVILVLIIKPGANGKTPATKMVVKSTTTQDNFLDMIRNAFPSNIVEATMYTHTTILIDPKDSSKRISDWEMNIDQLAFATNFLGLIVIATVIGVAMGYMGETVSLVADVVNSINEVFIKITFLIIKVSAPGIFSLVLSQILEVEDFEQTIKQIGMYTLTNIVGLIIIILIIIPVTYSIFLNKLPFRMLWNALPVLSTAFATSSSLVTLPTTLKCAEESNHIDPRVTRFVIPLGTTVNMNGTALYVTIAPLFLAQLINVDINFGQYLAVCITATLASVGVAAIPQSGIVAMVMVMTLLGVNPEMLGIIFTVDWLLDRCCTCVNVFGDLVASSIIEKLSRKQLMIENE